ncbi:unnamed protein product [Trichobilharzia regenti]|nr:unnamed protein product [Trichobilharzia regenti]
MTKPIISRLKSPVLSLKLRRAIQSFLRESSTTNHDNNQIIQHWDKFSLEVVGDKLRQTLASCISTNTNSGNLNDKASNEDSAISKAGDPGVEIWLAVCIPLPAYIKLWILITFHVLQPGRLGNIINLPEGTQSANPHNDYCQHFVDTGERPQNFIRDTGMFKAIGVIKFLYYINIYIYIYVCFGRCII